MYQNCTRSRSSSEACQNILRDTSYKKKQRAYWKTKPRSIVARISTTPPTKKKKVRFRAQGKRANRLAVKTENRPQVQVRPRTSGPWETKSRGHGPSHVNKADDQTHDVDPDSGLDVDRVRERAQISHFFDRSKLRFPSHS